MMIQSPVFLLLTYSMLILAGFPFFTHAADDFLKQEYMRHHANAQILAGQPGDIPQRVAVLQSLYDESKGNYAFPQVALHGALWGYRYFEVTGRLGQITSVRYFYDQTLRDQKMAELDAFATKFKDANRQVFIDTYTNFKFTKEFAFTPYTDLGIVAQYIPQSLFQALTSMHQKIFSGKSLNANEKRSLFIQALLNEQERTVAPRVAKAISEFDCPILTQLGLMPVVHFTYFPASTYFFFRDFSNKEERIHYAIQSYDLAVKAGWPKVYDAVIEYGVLPKEYFENPNTYVIKMKRDLGVLD